MQLNGIGDYHRAEQHQVTRCLHDHESTLKGGAGLQIKPGATASQTLQQKVQQPEFSLADWLRQILQRGRQRLFGLWNGAETVSGGEKAAKGEASSAAPQLNDNNVANAQGTVDRAAILQNNPFFSAVAEPPKASGATLMRKIRLKCKSVAGQLSRHLPERFYNLQKKFQKRGSSQAKKENPREDLRRRSKYREDQLEIDCVLTDESYLLDSYDRKGEYSQLTTKK